MNAFHSRPHGNFRQTGVTFVELLIGKTILLVVIAGMLAFVTPATGGIQQARSNSDIQDAARAAVGHIRDAVQFAGYQGCRGDTSYTTVIDTDSSGVSARLSSWAYRRFGIRGFTADDAAGISAALGSGWQQVRYEVNNLPVGDLLVVQNARFAGMTLAWHDPVNQILAFAGRHTGQLQPGQILQLNDCRHSARLQLDQIQPARYISAANITTVHYAPSETINCRAVNYQTLALGPAGSGGCQAPADADPTNIFAFEPGTTGHVVDSAVYYIGDDSGTGKPALKRSGFAGNARRIYTETLVEGVENMRLRYAVDSDNDEIPDIDYNANEINQRADSQEVWRNVVGVTVWLMTRSWNRTASAGASTSIRFPAANGLTMDCSSVLPSSPEDYQQHLSACPFHGARPRQYKRQVVLQTIPLENPNL